MTSDPTVVAETSGRRVLLALAAVVLVLAAGVGALVGAVNAGRDVLVFGLVSVPASGPAFALFGFGLALAVLSALFALVTVAGRLEERGL